jgi:hypothetical protein
MPLDLTDTWLEALERRHLAELTTSEVGRALRALSSCYVERRSKLEGGGALSSKGKRAAFALFYGPQHLLITREILNSLPTALEGITSVVDLGCGTGAAGAAWGIATRARTIQGLDRHPWAVAEANATYRTFRLRGRAVQRDIAHSRLRAGTGTGIVAAYAVNELAHDGRAFLLAEMLNARARGARVLVVEPIARRSAGWWDGWQAAVVNAGGRADEWRFPQTLPPVSLALARAAGLEPRELTARSLWF